MQAALRPRPGLGRRAFALHSIQWLPFAALLAGTDDATTIVNSVLGKRYSKHAYTLLTEVSCLVVMALPFHQISTILPCGNVHREFGVFLLQGRMVCQSCHPQQDTNCMTTLTRSMYLSILEAGWLGLITSARASTLLTSMCASSALCSWRLCGRSCGEHSCSLIHDYVHAQACTEGFELGKWQELWILSDTLCCILAADHVGNP